MLHIEQGYELQHGDLAWLNALSIIMITHGHPVTEYQIEMQYLLARDILKGNCGDVWTE